MDISLQTQCDLFAVWIDDETFHDEMTDVINDVINFRALNRTFQST